MAFKIWGIVIALDTASQYIILGSGMKASMNYGVVFPYIALPMGTIVTICFL